MKSIILLSSCLLLTSCTRMVMDKSFVKDIERTPSADAGNVYVNSKDTVDTLSGKIIILNSRLDSCSDYMYGISEKLERYR